MGLQVFQVFTKALNHHDKDVSLGDVSEELGVVDSLAVHVLGLLRVLGDLHLQRSLHDPFHVVVGIAVVAPTGTVHCLQEINAVPDSLSRSAPQLSS